MSYRFRPLLSIAFGAALLAACGVTPPATTSYQLDVTLDGTGTGTVTSDPAGIDAGNLSAEFDEATDVTLTATAADGSSFTEWSGDCTGATCTVTMDAAKSVTATFTEDAPPPPETATLSVSIVNGGAADGSVTSAPAGIDASNTSADFNVGDDVVLTASAASGGFYGWQGGDCDGLETLTCTVTVDTGEPAVTALFNDIVPVTVQVGADRDDSEEFLDDADPAADGWFADLVEGFSSGGQDLELGYDTHWAVQQAVGLRFVAPSVPAGARITSTVLGFTASDNEDFGPVGPPAGSAGTMTLTITGQAADDAGNFTGYGLAGYALFDITSRARTAASVTWSESETWTADSVYESADVTSIFEEIRSRPGWVDGQHMVFILEPDDAASTEYRRAVTNDTDLGSEPTLTIEYVEDPTL